MHSKHTHMLLRTQCLKGQQVANKLGAVAYVECSALENIGVMEVFETAARAALGHAPPRPPKTQSWLRRSLKITPERRLRLSPATAATQTLPGASEKAVNDKNTNYLVANMPDPFMWSFEIESAIYSAMANSASNDSGTIYN